MVLVMVKRSLHRTPLAAACALVLCGALTLAGCGAASGATGATGSSPATHNGNASTAAPSANVKAVSCSRVSLATVSQAVGFQLSAPVESHAASDPLDTVCQYAVPANGANVLINYEIGKLAPFSYQAVIEVTAPADLQLISGFGDKAFFDKSAATLHVLKGNLYFNVGLFELPETDNAKQLANAEQIATAILAGS
jgi:hypothetical protein